MQLPKCFNSRPLPRSSSRASLQRSDENSYTHSRRFAPLDMPMIQHPISLLCVLLRPLTQISPGLPYRFSKPIVYAYSSAFRGNPCISMLYILRGRLCTARFAIRYLSVWWPDHSPFCPGGCLLVFAFIPRRLRPRLFGGVSCTKAQKRRTA